MSELSGAVKVIRQKIREASKDGFLDEDETDAIYDFIDRVVNGGVGELFGGNSKILQMLGLDNVGLNSKYHDLMKEFFGDDAEREATKKGFASMSQDSADELNGRFTAIQGMVIEINSNTKKNAERTAVMLQRLAGIEANTEFCRRLNGMDSDIRAVKTTLETIRDRGIRIYS